MTGPQAASAVGHRRASTTGAHRGWASGALRVLEGNLVAYRRTWRGNAFSTFLQPVLFLSAMGLGLGSLIDRGQQLGQLSYLTFYASGLLAAQAMQTGVSDAAFPVMSGFKWTRSYHTALLTPISIRDMVLGQTAFISLRVTLATAAFAVAASAFGAFGPLAALAAVPVALLCGLSYALPVMAFTASQEQESRLIPIFRFGLVPMFLLSGTFFPLDQLPAWLQAAARVVPLWHAIEVVRAITLGQPSAWPWPAHVGYLLVWVAVGAVVAPIFFRRRLVS